MAATLQRITDLAAPPTLRARYLVPTVEYNWKGRRRAWPVFLPFHEDRQFFNFAHPHYHIDPRFLDKRTLDWAGRSSWPTGGGPGWDALAALQASPLSRRSDSGVGNDPHPPVVWQPVRCFRTAVPYVHGDKGGVIALRAHYQGQTAPRNRAGWVCPHQHFHLGSIAPDADGLITCPLHGLRIRAADGRCMAEA